MGEKRTDLPTTFWILQFTHRCNSLVHDPGFYVPTSTNFPNI